MPMPEISNTDQALKIVAQKLFGPSDECLLKVAVEGQPFIDKLPASMKELLQQGEFPLRIELLRESLKWANEELQGEADAYQLALRASTAARGVGSGAASVSRAGECRFVPGVDLNNPSSAERFTQSLLVLLDDSTPIDQDVDPSNSGDKVWSAWVLSPYVAFAGWYDVMLQGDKVPTSCAMVQAWNRVSVAESTLGGLEFTVSTDALAEVRAVWREFLSEDEPEGGVETENAMGYLHTRSTLDGLSVVTGTAMTGPDDPRIAFRGLSSMAGQAVIEACRAIVFATEPSEKTAAQPAIAPQTRPTFVQDLVDSVRKLPELEVDAAPDIGRPELNPSDAFERFLRRLGIRPNGAESTIKQRARSLALVAVVGLGAALVIQQQTRQDPDEVVMRGASIVIKSSDPMSRCRAIEANLLAAGLKKGVQVLLSEDDKQRQCRVAAMDLDDDSERAAAAAVFNKEGLKVEPAGRLEVTVVKRD